MLNKTKLAVSCGIVTLMAGICFAQNEGGKASGPTRYFHLDYVVKELEGGKVVNARHYSTAISTGEQDRSDIRAGNKLPVVTGGKGSDTQFTYIDLGVNVDSRAAKEMGGDLALNVTAEVSSVANTPKPSDSPGPLIRQNKWSANVIVPIAKPTVIFSSDDVSTKGVMQLELTATPIR